MALQLFLSESHLSANIFAVFVNLPSQPLEQQLIEIWVCAHQRSQHFRAAAERRHWLSSLLVRDILFTFYIQVVILVASVTLLFWVNEQLACFLSLQPLSLFSLGGNRERRRGRETV